MSIFNDESTTIRYWCHGLWRTILNALPLSEIELKGFEWVPSANIEKGSLTQRERSIWIAPVVAFNSTLQQYWIPLWIPAKIQADELLYNSEQLPWIAPSQFDPLNDFSPLSEPLHCFDDWLRYECLDSDGKINWKNWHEAYSACIELLNKLSDGEWSNRLNAAAYAKIDQSLIIDEEKLLNLMQGTAAAPSLLLTHYAEEADIEPKPQLEPSHLGLNAQTACTHALILEKGELLAIKTPMGSNIESFLGSILTAKMTRATLDEKSTPSIFLLTPRSQFANWQWPDNFSSQSAFIAKQALYQEKEGRDFSEPGSLEAHLAHLQQQDEDHEKELIKLMALQQQKAKRSLKSLWITLFSRKKIQQAKMQLSDKIRQCKVLRTKIHQNLVELVELINLKNKIARSSPPEKNDQQMVQPVWKEWYLFKCDPTQMHPWQSVQNREEIAHLLIIDSAHRLLPQQVAPFLNKAERALFLGDNKEILPQIVLSAVQEEWELKLHQYQEETYSEQLQCKGMLTGSGNAFAVAMANSSYQKSLAPGLFAVDLSLIEHETAQGLQCKMFPILGKSERAGNAFYNEIEAQQITSWLQNGPLCHALNEVAIVTLFAPQRTRIEQCLKDLGLDCPVYTVYHLPYRQFPYLIFSSVYVLGDNRPFLFDQGEQLLYSLKSRVTNTLWICGDSRIFDPKMHSPSGNLAKLLEVEAD